MNVHNCFLTRAQILCSGVNRNGSCSNCEIRGQECISRSVKRAFLEHTSYLLSDTDSNSSHPAPEPEDGELIRLKRKGESWECIGKQIGKSPSWCIRRCNTIIARLENSLVRCKGCMTIVLLTPDELL
jgi:hypothetical protein